MESDIPSSSNQSSITQFFNRLRATDIAGTYRKHAARHIIRVPVDGSRLHTSFSSLYKRVLIPRIRRAVNIPAHDVVQRTNDAANYLARTTIEQMAVCLRNKLESYGEPQIARDLLGVTPLAVGTDQLAFAATLIETFGTFSVMERHHDRVLYVAELTRGSNGRFGCTAAQWNRDHDVGASAFGALKMDHRVQIVPVNYNSTAEDPWWLMDTVVNNMDELSRDFPNEDAISKMLSPVAQISVYSIFEPNHLTDISKSMPSLLLPETFGSMAIRVESIWSPWVLAPPTEAQAPPPTAGNRVFNLTRSFWLDQFVREDRQHAIEVEEPSTSRQRIESGPSGSPMRVTQNVKQYRIKRIRTYYDHCIIENTNRGDIIASFGVFEAAGTTAR